MAKRIALDSGALIKLGDGDATIRALIEHWTKLGYETVVPVPVLAETLRGGVKDARINRILNSRACAMTIAATTESAARDAGKRLGAAAMTSDHTVDALIVATSVAAHAEKIVTGDPSDITPLAGLDLSVLSM